MAEITSGLAFRGSKSGERSMAVRISSGTATLEKLAGNDPDVVANFIPVSGGAFSADGEMTFFAPHDQYFRILLTGDAFGNLSQ